MKMSESLFSKPLSCRGVRSVAARYLNYLLCIFRNRAATERTPLQLSDFCSFFSDKLNGCMSNLNFSKILLYATISCAFIINITSCSNDSPVADPISVDAQKVSIHNIPYTLNYPAMVQGVVDYPVIPRISGALYKQYYTEGTPVKKDQPLYQIDPRPFELALKGYEGQWIKDKAARDDYGRIYKRYVDLYQYKAVSTQDVENARINYQAAVGNVKTDEANIEQEKLNLRYCLVRSPADGYIGERLVTVGDMVTAFQTQLNHINSVNQMYLLFSMPENQRLEIEEGVINQTLSIPENNTFSLDIELANGKIIPKSAYVEFTDTRISLENGSWNMRGYVNNNTLKNKLLSGQYVTVYLHGLDYLNVFNLPQEAVMQDDKGAFVYVVQEKDKQQKAFKRYVKPGKMFNHDQWIILSGLKDGELVVTKGNIRLNEGDLVIIDNTISQNGTISVGAPPRGRPLTGRHGGTAPTKIEVTERSAQQTQEVKKA